MLLFWFDVALAGCAAKNQICLCVWFFSLDCEEYIFLSFFCEGWYFFIHEYMALPCIFKLFCNDFSCAISRVFARIF